MSMLGYRALTSAVIRSIWSSEFVGEGTSSVSRSLISLLGLVIIVGIVLII